MRVYKQTKKPVKRELIKDGEDLTLHMDICGPTQEQKFKNKRYFLAVTVTPHLYVRAERITQTSKP